MARTDLRVDIVPSSASPFTSSPATDDCGSPSKSMLTQSTTVTNASSGSGSDSIVSPQTSEALTLAFEHGAILEDPGSDLMLVTAEQMEYLRVHAKGAEHADEATLKRFVRATGGNLQLSARRLAATLAWRAEVKPEQVVCNACAKNPRSHYMHLAGYCRRGRPIIYSCLELAANKDYEDNKAHMLQTFEMAVKCMPPGAEQWIWVCDFHGFGMADVNPKLAKLFLDLSAEHYPERLGLFMIVDAPSLFGMLWRAIKGFVDPKTHRKIRFLPFDHKAGSSSPSSLQEEMDIHFDAVTTAWLLREMAENRNKKQAASKVYNMYTIYERAQNGELCDHEHKHCHHGHLAASRTKQQQQQQQQQEAATSTSAAAVKSNGVSAVVHMHARSSSMTASTAAALALEVHNCCGTPALLHAYNAQPNLLLPQATATARDK